MAAADDITPLASLSLTHVYYVRFPLLFFPLSFSPQPLIPS
jgi:hypothetical protein